MIDRIMIFRPRHCNDHMEPNQGERQLLDAGNTQKSLFFSLSSAVRTAKTKTLQHEDTELDIVIGLIIKMDQSSVGSAFLIG